MENCTIWKGLIWSGGRYGMDKINGKCMGAHRAAWIRVNGEIPKGMVICHKCDNGLCVNVNHLFIGTSKDNMQDCIRKGRFVFTLGNQEGQNNNNAKPHLAERYKKIKKDRKNGLTYSQLRLKYEIKSNGHLRYILTYKF